MRSGSAANSKTGLFLMELIIMLLFFALCAAVCMRMFGAAQASSDYSRDLSEASLRAQSAAECYKAAEGDLGSAARLLGLSEEVFVLTEAMADADGSTFTIFYDSAWEPAKDGPEEASYTLTVAEREADLGSGGAEITVVKSGEEEPLFEIQVKAVVLHGN